MMKQTRAVPPVGKGQFPQRAPLSVSPGVKEAISLFIRAENSFNSGSCQDATGYSDAVLLCKEIIAKYASALSDGHSNTLVDTKLLLAKSLWHLGRDEEALAVLTEASKAAAHPELSEWIGICQKK